MQIFMNYLLIFILPFLLGALLRFLMRKRSRGWIVTVIAAALALTMLIVAVAVPNHGSEANGLMAYQAACLLVGSLLVGGVLLIVRRKRKMEQRGR